MKRIALIAAALALASGPASANVVFDLSDVTLQGGGEMTGSITLSDNLATVVDLNITVPAAVLFGFPFNLFTYTAAADVITAQLPINAFIRADAPNGNEMQLDFTQITNAGVASFFLNNSYDNQPSGGTRLVTGGSLVPAADLVADVDPVPLPATWTLMLVGLAGLGFFASRARRSGPSALAA
jgi:hypothetical protein